MHNNFSKMPTRVNALRLCYALALAVVGSLANSSHASILQSDLAPSAEAAFELIAQSGATSSAPQAPTNQPTNDPQKSPADVVLHHAFNLEGPGSNGPSSTTSPSSSGSANGGSMPFMASAALCLTDDQSAMSLAIFQTISLPTPPGADLLRPPQYRAV